MTTGHAETVVFVEQLLTRIEGERPSRADSYGEWNRQASVNIDVKVENPLC